MNNDKLQELKQRKINQIRAAQCKAVFLENYDSKDFECVVKDEFIEIRKKGCYQFPVFRVPIDFDYTNDELLQFAKTSNFS